MNDIDSEFLEHAEFGEEDVMDIEEEPNSRDMRSIPSSFYSMESPKEEENFTVLHNKVIAVEQVSLCDRMDLCCVLHSDGSIGVFRTTTDWQKIAS